MPSSTAAPVRAGSGAAGSGQGSGMQAMQQACAGRVWAYTLSTLLAPRMQLALRAGQLCDRRLAAGTAACSPRCTPCPAIPLPGSVGSTLYGHMLQGSAGATGTKKQVKAGDVIGKCGSTGGSTGPHLHLDYIPSNLFTFSGHVDPAPCLSKLAAGSITIGDNGGAADDSFEVGHAVSCNRCRRRCGVLALRRSTSKRDPLALLPGPLRHRSPSTTRPSARQRSARPTRAPWAPSKWAHTS